MNDASPMEGDIMKSHSVDISCGAEIINHDDLKSIGINEVAADNVLQLFFWEFPDGWSTVENYEDGICVYIVDKNGMYRASLYLSDNDEWITDVYETPQHAEDM